MLYVNCCPRIIFTHELINRTEGSVPPPLGDNTYYTLINSFGGMKRTRRDARCEMRDAKEDMAGEKILSGMTLCGQGQTLAGLVQPSCTIQGQL